MGRSDNYEQANIGSKRQLRASDIWEQVTIGSKQQLGASDIWEPATTGCKQFWEQATTRSNRQLGASDNWEASRNWEQATLGASIGTIGSKRQLEHDNWVQAKIESKAIGSKRHWAKKQASNWEQANIVRASGNWEQVSRHNLESKGQEQATIGRKPKSKRTLGASEQAIVSKRLRASDIWELVTIRSKQ